LLSILSDDEESRVARPPKRRRAEAAAGEREFAQVVGEGRLVERHPAGGGEATSIQVLSAATVRFLFARPVTGVVAPAASTLLETRRT
jgi:hypothetical protein